MTQEQKSRPSLGATIATGVLGGALVGYLAGSGVEDILHKFSVNPPIEYMKTILSVIGALSWPSLGTLQYFNRDEHEGRLIIHVLEKQKPEKPRVKPKPNLEGLACAIEQVTNGVHNRNLANNLYLNAVRNLQRDPLSNVRYSYKIHRSGFFAKSFNVFVPFTYNQRVIDPKETLDKFFDVWEELYSMTIEGLSDSAERLVRGQPAFRDLLPINFRETLAQEISLAQDVALWANYLSKREGIVGSKVRQKLDQFGITHPDSLAEDIKIIGQKVLNFYDSK